MKLNEIKSKEDYFIDKCYELFSDADWRIEWDDESLGGAPYPDEFDRIKDYLGCDDVDNIKGIFKLPPDPERMDIPEVREITRRYDFFEKLLSKLDIEETGWIDDHNHMFRTVIHKYHYAGINFVRVDTGSNWKTYYVCKDSLK